MLLKKGLFINTSLFICITNLLGNSACAYSTLKSHWQFSPLFLAHYKPQEIGGHPIYQTIQPPLFTHLTAPHYPQEPSIIQANSSLFSHENAQCMVNIAAIVFATIKIYQRYETLHLKLPTALNDQSWASAIKTMIISSCPSILQSASTNGVFLIDSTTIIFEVLIYKSIAKLLLLCAYGDIVDLLRSIAHGGFNTAKQLLCTFKKSIQNMHA